MAPSVALTTLVACAIAPLLGSSTVLAFNPLARIDRPRQRPAGMRISGTNSQLGVSSASHGDLFGVNGNGDAENAGGSINNRRRRAASVVFEDRKKEWVNRSLNYYSKVMREEKRRNRGQIPHTATPDEHEQQIELAQKHYFALRKIKSGQLNHAERIYRRIIEELSADEDGCDHAKLAVSTLLLALLLQRMGDIKATRSVFLNFFRIAVLEADDDGKECACSAKVLQAYALFEMRRGHGKKSLEIVEQAVKLDEDLKPVLAWKQFRDVISGV